MVMCFENGLVQRMGAMMNRLLFFCVFLNGFFYFGFGLLL
jgi:hypothetical protein